METVVAFKNEVNKFSDRNFFSPVLFSMGISIFGESVLKNVHENN